MVVGIDLGISGALCLFDERLGMIITLIDMPVYTDYATNRKKLDVADLNAHLIQFKKMGADLVIYEKVHAMPSVGVNASFSMGHASGVLQALCEAHDLHSITVAPASWKRHYGLIKATKDDSIEKAKGLNVGGDRFLRRKKDHNRAEAILLASLPGEFLESHDLR